MGWFPKSMMLLHEMPFRGSAGCDGSPHVIQINAVARLPPRMAHGIRPKTDFHHRSSRYCDCHLCRSGRLPCLRSVCHSGDTMKAYGALDWRRHVRHIVDEAGEIIAKVTNDHALVGGHHRLAVAASLGQKLFWKHTGEPVKLDPFYKGSSNRDTA